jgi:hypothetical protein
VRARCASLSNWNTRPSRLCLTRAGFADNVGSAVRAPDLSFLAPLEASMVLPLRYLQIVVSCILIRMFSGWESSWAVCNDSRRCR